MNSLDEQILKLRIQIEKETNVEIKKILLAQKKQLEETRMLVGNIYMKYSNTEGLNMPIGDRNREMKKVEKVLIDMRSNLAKTTITIASAALTKSYVNGYYKTANIIDTGVSVGINYKILRPEFIDAVVHANFQGQPFSNRIWKHQDELIAKLYNTIGKGITEGTKIQILSKEIKDAFGSTSFQAQRLVQNEMSRVVSQAQDNIYQESGVVNELMFVATLDNLTSEICQNLDGNRYKLDDNYPKIPDDTHIMCRSCYVPVVEGWNPKVRRDQEKKENIPFQNYEQWSRDN